MGFAERMTRLRHELAGPRSSLAEFAALLDVSRQNLQRWEDPARQLRPRGGIDWLASTLVRLGAVRSRGLDARAVASWVWTGDGPDPFGARPRRRGPRGGPGRPSTPGSPSSAAAQVASAGFARSPCRLPRSAYAHPSEAQGLAWNLRKTAAAIDFVGFGCHYIA